MVRILLVIDDYNEMIYLQTLLKKLGFDVDSLSNTRKFADTLLGFNPKIVIITAHGKKINGLELTSSIVRRNGLPRIFLIKNQGQVFGNGELSDEKIDRILESPVNFLNLVKCICEFETSLNYENISLKLSNIMTSDKLEKEVDEKEYNINDFSRDENEIIHISGNSDKDKFIAKPTSSVPVDQRKENYQNFLKKMENPPQGNGGFIKDKIKDYNKKNRISHKEESIVELDSHKKDFVRALFSHLKKGS
ncbi:MAG: hypothetical protein H6625_09820 [Bdellovibrionaceae bacterium]|nr:hypothetical protein [Pseudobdellovibrionaceae bacterium]